MNICVALLKYVILVEYNSVTRLYIIDKLVYEITGGGFISYIFRISYHILSGFPIGF